MRVLRAMLRALYNRKELGLFLFIFAFFSGAMFAVPALAEITCNGWVVRYDYNNSTTYSVDESLTYSPD